MWIVSSVVHIKSSKVSESNFKYLRFVQKSASDSYIFVSSVPLFGYTGYKRGWVNVELLPEILEVLLPPPLVKDAEDAPRPPSILKGPGPQRREEALQTACA